MKSTTKSASGDCAWHFISRAANGFAPRASEAEPHPVESTDTVTMLNRARRVTAGSREEFREQSSRLMVERSSSIWQPEQVRGIGTRGTAGDCSLPIRQSTGGDDFSGKLWSPPPHSPAEHPRHSRQQVEHDVRLPYSAYLDVGGTI